MLCLFLAIDCIWSPWTYSGLCSSKCGRGTRRKSRTKDTEDENGGICVGEPTSEDICQDCTGAIFLS